MISDLINWLEKHQLPCFWKKNFEIDCLGCGMQRSFIELLRGNLAESIILYPALIPLIITFVFLALHLKFKFNKGALILKVSFILTTLLMVINFLIKLF